MFPIGIIINREFDDEFMQGLFELTDSGISYWAELHGEGTEFHDDSGEIVTAINVRECEDRTLKHGETKEHRISGQTFRLGFERILKGEVPINTRQLGSIAVAFITSEISMIDGEDVDLIIQAGLYNDIKWG